MSVPVLSNIAVRTIFSRSKIAGSLMMMPRLAAREIAPMTATGMAISRGQGVATTRTAKKRRGSPLAHQANSATARARGV